MRVFLHFAAVTVLALCTAGAAFAAEVGGVKPSSFNTRSLTRIEDSGARDGGFANQKPCLRHSIIHAAPKKIAAARLRRDGFSRQIAAITWPCRSVEGQRCSRCSYTSR